MRQRGVHVAAQSLRLDRWLRLHGQPETGTEIVHREDQGIIGALLACQYLNPVPAVLSLGRGGVETRAVAVVEQRREQRRRRRHGAAALRQRQRGMLVSQQLASRAWVRRTPSATLSSPILRRTGRVLMNMPSTRSAPSPPCMRPNSTVPNTTSSRPVVRASTCAQARWHRLAALTPRARACSRRRRARSESSSQHRFFDPRAVALHVEQTERRRRFAPRRPASRGRMLRALLG